ncbi:MAG: hypothetical protein WC378_09780, partial [Opitutaceae bacterium]
MPSWIKRLQSPSWPTLLVLAGVLIVILGAKGGLIHRFGSDVPYMDQWDAEARMLLIPSAEGKLGVENFIAPHNEHRLVLTKLLNYCLTKLNKQWSPLLEMTLGALIHVCAIGTLLAFARRHLPAPAFSIVAIFAGLLFALSYAWENTLQGFQSQFYLLMWSAIGSIWLMTGANTLGKRWWLGFAVMLIGFGSMSSGFVAAAAIGATLVLRGLVERRWEWRDSAMLAALALTCITGVLLTRHVPGHDVLRAASIGEFLNSFFSCLAWPVIKPLGWALLIQLPAAVLAISCIRQHRLRSPDAAILAFSIWCWLQLAALAYARGHMSPTVSSRYTDLMAVGLLVNAIALGRMWMGWAERLRLIVAIAWALAVMPALLGLGTASTAFLATTFSEKRAEETRLLKEFLRTQDEAVLRQAPVGNLPHPSADTIIRVLRHPGMQPLLPAPLRSGVSRASNPEETGLLSSANRHWLKQADALKSVGLSLILLGVLGVAWNRRKDIAGAARQVANILSRNLSAIFAPLLRLGSSILRVWPILGKSHPQSNPSAQNPVAIPPRQRNRSTTLLAVAALVLLVLGARFGLIQRYGSDLPFMDTWDAEADLLFISHADGRLAAQNFWWPHNEHHVLWTRLLNFGLATANRQWDPKLETTVNAFLPAALAATLLLFARKRLRGIPFILAATVLGLLFVLPIGYENSLNGFQSQFYFLSLSAFGTIWLCTEGKPAGIRWCAGAAIALAGLASMASGFLAPIAILAVAGFRFITERRMTPRDLIGALIIGLVAVAGVLWINPVPLHAEFHAKSAAQFVQFLVMEMAWPCPAYALAAIVMQTPVVVLLIRAWRHRRFEAWDAVVLGLALWSWLQMAAIAYG